MNLIANLIKSPGKLFKRGVMTMTEMQAGLCVVAALLLNAVLLIAVWL